jgi:hypothetical protein
VSTETPKFPTVVMFLSKIPNNSKTLEISKQIPYNWNPQNLDSYYAPTHSSKPKCRQTLNYIEITKKKMNEKDIHLLFRFGWENIGVEWGPKLRNRCPLLHPLLPFEWRVKSSGEQILKVMFWRGTRQWYVWVRWCRG